MGATSPRLVTASELRSQETKQAIIAMLDHNRPWPRRWRFPQRRRLAVPVQDAPLSYTFHTVREDVREIAAFNSQGEVVLEVARDGQGKMKDQLGDRRIALNSREYASSRRGANVAWVHDRTDHERDQPFDLALKHYARIGCQFDLPLFRYRELLDSAALSRLKKGSGNGQPCQVATVSIPGGDAYLGCGTMLAFTSWNSGYPSHTSQQGGRLHRCRPRKVPVHETLTSLGDGKVFEIDFSDYIEVEPGQHATPD